MKLIYFIKMIGKLNSLDYSEYLFEPQSKFCVQTRDHITAITTINGILILRLKPIFTRPPINVSYLKFLITPSTYKLIDHIEIDSGNFIFGLKHDSVHSTLLQSSLSGSLENIKKTSFSTSKCSMSPLHLLGEECVMATINDLGAVDIYVKVCHINGLNKYEHLQNVSQLHVQRFKFRWKDSAEMAPEDLFEEAKRRLDIHSTKSISWTHILENKIKMSGNKGNILIKKYSCLITGHYDGKICFWQFDKQPIEDYKTAALTFLYEAQPKKYKLGTISALHWHVGGATSGLLIVGDVFGRTIIIPMLNLVKNYLECGEEMLLIDTTDITVDFIDSDVKNNFLLVYVVQQSHLLLFVLDKDAQIMQRMDYNCLNLQITGFQKTRNGSIVLSTLPGTILEIKATLTDGKLDFQKRCIYLNMDWTKQSLFGIFLSKNNAMLSLVTYHYGYHYKGNIVMKVWNFSNNASKALEQFIQLDRVTDGWDLLEVIKLESLVKREIIIPDPTIDIDFDILSLSQLKKQYWVIKTLESVVDQVDSVVHYNLLRADDIDIMITINLSIYLLTEIIKELKESSAVSNYKGQIAHICFTHLKEIAISDFLEKYDLTKNYSRQITHVLEQCTLLNIKEDIDCNLCEQKIIGLSCHPGHADIRCSFTMVQLLNAKYKCPMCERFISTEAFTFLEDANLNCIYCDSPMETIVGYENRPLEIESLCMEDCLSNIL